MLNFLPTALLILLSAALGFLVAWTWRARQFQAIARANRRLRRQRVRLLRMRNADQARHDAAQANLRIAEEELALLNQAHVALESEHAKLVSRYANLTRAARARLGPNAGPANAGGDGGRIGEPGTTAGEGAATQETHADEIAQTDVRARTSPPGSAGPGGNVDRPPGPASAGVGVAPDGSGESSAAPPDTNAGWSETASGATTAAWFGTAAMTPGESAPTRPRPDVAGSNELEVLSAQVATAGEALAQPPDEPEPAQATGKQPAEVTDTQAAGAATDFPRDLSEPLEDDVDFADSGIGDDDPIGEAAAQLEAMRQVLEAREQEIASLREQIAPLLGLPLAVSTREAERDRLARRLAQREADIAALQQRLTTRPRDDARPAAGMAPPSRAPLDWNDDDFRADMQDPDRPEPGDTGADDEGAEDELFDDTAGDHAAADVAPSEALDDDAIADPAIADEGVAAGTGEDEPGKDEPGADDESGRVSDRTPAPGRRDEGRSAQASVATPPDPDGGREGDGAPTETDRSAGRLGDQPPALHSEVPLDDLLADIRALDRGDVRDPGAAAGPGRNAARAPGGEIPAPGDPASGETPRPRRARKRPPRAVNPTEEVPPFARRRQARPPHPGSPAAGSPAVEDPADRDAARRAPAAPLASSGPEPDRDGRDTERDSVSNDRDEPGPADQPLAGEAWPDTRAIRRWQREHGGESLFGVDDTGPAVEPTPPRNERGSPVPRQYTMAPARVDDLKRIVGIGPIVERMLNRLGVYELRQIAAWTDEDAEFFDAQLGEFAGRIERDHWVEQARALLRAD